MRPKDMLVNPKYRQDKRAQKKLKKKKPLTEENLNHSLYINNNKKITTSKGFTLYFLLKC